MCELQRCVAEQNVDGVLIIIGRQVFMQFADGVEDETPPACPCCMMPGVFDPGMHRENCPIAAATTMMIEAPDDEEESEGEAKT